MYRIHSSILHFPFPIIVRTPAHHRFFDTSAYIFVRILSVRDQTSAAVLYALCGIAEISSAITAKRIERTIAEKTVEITAVCDIVTRKKFAFPVAEKSVARHIYLLSPVFEQTKSALFRERTVFYTIKRPPHAMRPLYAVLPQKTNDPRLNRSTDLTLSKAPRYMRAFFLFRRLPQDSYVLQWLALTPSVRSFTVLYDAAPSLS